MSQIPGKLNITTIQVENVFFKAMLAGYVSNTKVKTENMPGMPGYKFTEFIDGDFCVKDVWCKSSGFTSIWYKGILVWTMSFGGEYSKACISFLKEVLRKAYVNKNSVGCRGSNIATNDEYTYVNKVVVGSNFARFHGTEYIFRAETFKKTGYHHYFGGLV